MRFQVVLGFAAVLGLSACQKGGELTLEPGANKKISKGSPFLQVNQGAKAMVVEQGQTPTTGVHGWITISPITSRSVSAMNGTQMIMNKSTALNK